MEHSATHYPQPPNLITLLLVVRLLFHKKSSVRILYDQSIADTIAVAHFRSFDGQYFAHAAVGSNHSPKRMSLTTTVESWASQNLPGVIPRKSTSGLSIESSSDESVRDSPSTNRWPSEVESINVNIGQVVGAR